MRLDASGRWFICLTVFRVGHEVESRSAEVSQDLVGRFRKRVLDDSLAIPGVPNFIAFEGVPSVFAKVGVPSRETSADWCAGEEYVKDWLLKKPPPTLLRNLWLDQRSSHMKPQGEHAWCFSLSRLRRGAQVPFAPQHAARSK